MNILAIILLKSSVRGGKTQDTRQLDAPTGKEWHLNFKQLLLCHLFRSPYGKTFKIVDKSTSYENGTVHCLCKVEIIDSRRITLFLETGEEKIWFRAGVWYIDRKYSTKGHWGLDVKSTLNMYQPFSIRFLGVLWSSKSKAKLELWKKQYLSMLTWLGKDSEDTYFNNLNIFYLSIKTRYLLIKEGKQYFWTRISDLVPPQHPQQPQREQLQYRK